MAIAELGLEPSREQLSQMILECLNSWPEHQRQVFVEIHYCGRSAAEVANALRLSPSEVARVLEQCEHRLYRALNAFRSGASPGMSGAPLPTYSASCCSH